MQTREAIPLVWRPQRPKGSASLGGVARITRDEVRKVAALARLSLGEDAAERMTSELDQILEYVQTLSQVDTTDTLPTAHPIPLPTPLREDRAVTPLDPELAVANAPQREGSAFVVPKVIEGDEEG
jgi:aspartyl-tRNA(Asn)/glutamyl-tRNA(Gln) amidotransferase subunit C